MLEILALLIALSAVATLARGRGASPVLAGTVAALGYVLLRYVGGALTRDENVFLALIVAGWAWVGAVFVFLRFGVGRGHAQPDGKWSCSNCRYLNNASHVVCEACGTPWRTESVP